MQYKSLIEALELPLVIQEKLLTYELTYQNEFLNEIEGLRKIETAFSTHQKLKQTLDDPNGLLMLYIFSKAIQENHKTYQALKISDRIYIETYKAITRFINEYYQETQTYAFERDWWAYRQVAMRIFRIGELEYELTYEKNEPIISIHIPSDARLSKARIEASLILARLFINSRFIDYKNVLMKTHTWLLSPALKGLLAPSSNILCFQSYFDIDEVFETDTSFLHWVFHTKETDFKALETKTSLQKNIKTHILKGGYIGAASGTINIDQLEYHLTIPNPSHETMIMAIKEELKLEGAYNGTSDLDKFDTYSKWLQSIKNPYGYTVKTTQYLLADRNQNIYGFVHIRHEIDEELSQTYGHVSVTIRPLYRHKGYAQLALSLALKRLSELGQHQIMVSSEETLAASIHTIESCFGIYERTTLDTYIHQPVRVYLINI